VIAENDMKETAQQYTQRMLAYMDGKQWTHYGQHSERGQESIDTSCACLPHTTSIIFSR